MQIEGRTFLVTGGASGLGGATARMLVGAGGNVVIYSMAKAAVVGFTRTQALEWAPYNINVNAIAPGLFPEPTAITAERAETMAAWAKKKIPLGRTGELREVGYLALYLASRASDYMTGQTLYLDGGLSL